MANRYSSRAHTHLRRFSHDAFVIFHSSDGNVRADVFWKAWKHMAQRILYSIYAQHIEAHWSRCVQRRHFMMINMSRKYDYYLIYYIPYNSTYLCTCEKISNLNNELNGFRFLGFSKWFIFVLAVYILYFIYSCRLCRPHHSVRIYILHLYAKRRASENYELPPTCYQTNVRKRPKNFECGERLAFSPPIYCSTRTTFWTITTKMN